MLGSATPGDSPLRQLWRDPIVRIFVFVELLVLAPYLMPWISAEAMERYAGFYATLPVKLVVMLALLHRPHRSKSLAERRFWFLIAGAYALWVVVQVMNITLPTAWRTDPGTERMQDLLFVGFYVMFALALETRPHDDSDRPGAARSYAYRSVGAILFTSGLLVYFMVIPREQSDSAFAHFFPSLFLYVIMDVYILTRLIAVRLACHDHSWRRVYGAMILTVVCWTTLDLIESFFYSGVMPWIPPGTSLDLVWHLPYCAIVMSARIREVPAPATAESARHHEYKGTWGGSLVLYAVAFPLIHFAVVACGVSDPEIRALQEIFVVAFVLVLATLALLYQKSLDKENRRLEAINRSVTEELQLSQRMEAVGRLAGGIAHDFNNVLQIVRACSGLVLHSLKDDAAQREDLMMIGDAVDRATALTDRLLTVSRRKKNDARPLNLNEVVNETGSMLRRMIGDDVVLTLAVDPDLPSVHADRGEMEQIIMNLGVNARDAMPDGGTLEIRTASTIDGEPNEHATLIIRDSGDGMDEETKAHLFEPFFSTKGQEQGTGLGLSMVYAIVLRSNGQIEVDSSVGEGTTFRIRLPACPSPLAAEHEVVTSADEERGGRESVLVVEDEDDVRTLVTRLLGGFGYEVASAKNGQEALRVLDNRSHPFDLLLTDVVMPGMKGPDLARSVRERHPSTRVLLMSGFLGDSYRSEVRGGELPLLRKPFTHQSLAAEVRKALDAKQLL